MRTLIVALALLGAGWAAMSTAGAAGCVPPEEHYDFFVAGFYEVGTLYRVWEESNGFAGLQAGNWSCDGRSGPRDRCVARTDENNAAIACPVSYMAGSL